MMDKPPAERGTALNAMIATALACWLGLALIAWWQASGGSDGFDRAGLLLWRNGPLLGPVGPEWLTTAMVRLTLLGGGAIRTPLVFAICIVLLIRKRVRDAALLAVTAITAAAVNSGLKLLFARPRPDIVHHLDRISDMSFPSGHSFNAAASYLCVALIMAGFAPHRRSLLIGAAMVLSLGVAFSRVWLGVHYPTDAIAGWLGGTGWTLLLAALAKAAAATRRKGMS